MSMGPDVKPVERRSQATPFAEDFMKELQGWLSEAFSQTAGPMQRESGTGPRQYLQSVAGINTAGSVANDTERIIRGVTEGSKLRTNRDAAAIREGFGASGNRISSSLAAKEGQFRNEAGINLEQLIGSILVNQADREQAARQFDVQGNIAAFNPIFGMASQGIIPDELIVTPGLGSQLLSGGLDFLGSYIGTGGRFGLGGNKPRSYPNTGLGGGQLPGWPAPGTPQIPPLPVWR